MHLRYKLMAWVALLGLLSACGFHLRRAPDLPPQMRTIYVSGNKGSDLVRYLRRNLATDSTKIVDDPSLASSTLDIIGVSQRSSLLAINSTGQPLEYKVFYQVEFSLLVGNTMLIEPQTLVLTRTYNYNITDAIGNQEQEENLYGAMAVDMAQLIVFRIQAAARAATRPPVTAAAPVKATVLAPASATRTSGH
ncbi:MAG: LPS assembly lipoprotein LptE [Gammaproteobacteria bacterium]